MSGLVSTDRVSLTRLTSPQPLREALAADVRRGLTGPRKWLPPISFYDARGSDLFERITELEEDSPTRVERQPWPATPMTSSAVAGAGPR